MAVVTISRQFGAGGYTLGKMLAARLNYQLVERDILSQVAREANVSAQWVEAVEKEAGGLLMRIISGLVSSEFIERQTRNSASDFDEKKYYAFLKKVVRQVAEDDEAVIIGRGGQFILGSDSEIVKVLLVAGMEDRIKFIMEHYHQSQNQAEQWIKKEEKRRTSFLKQLDPRDPDDPSIYDLIINTTRITLPEAEEMIAGLVGLVVDEHAKPIW